MSNSWDDVEKHINSELARIDDDYRQRTLAQNKLFESSLVGLANIAISWLEKDKQIDSQTANIIRNSVRVVDNIFKLFFNWF
ncbi:hypothetical protein [Planktothrix sp. FACHB-1365]|uniref:hypothetical protein n=1 Tax=Planktothrix sp. FACHB-1365 TaxID=2692855 RepID=UPI001687B751|nr:hypothetical protein [Planktothrix sp. FACHB-1365]MBD2482568.1 hypothetical protein [Planktothrix sp. FACHB-1365]